ncbi:MAG: hypothetical protein AAFQ42_09355 [Pseudomonadota bacterium]
MPTSHSTAEFTGRPYSFVHVPKTAGVTLTHLLEGTSAPYSLDEDLRAHIVRDHADFLHRSHGVLFWHIHYGALESFYGRRFMDRRHSFAFLRNPWDWLVSMYHYIRAPENRHYEQMIVAYMTFSEFLSFWRAKRTEQFDYVSSGTELGVRKLYRFEDLPNCLGELAGDIGIDAPDVVPRLNTSERDAYQQYYTPETARLVRELCPNDIELGGYDF